MTKNYIMIIIYSSTIVVNSVEAKLEILTQLGKDLGLKINEYEFIKTRKLAYKIRNDLNGHYAMIDFSIPEDMESKPIFTEILRKNKLDSSVIRQMILEKGKADFIVKTIKSHAQQ